MAHSPLDMSVVYDQYINDILDSKTQLQISINVKLTTYFSYYVTAQYL